MNKIYNNMLGMGNKLCRRSGIVEKIIYKLEDKYQ